MADAPTAEELKMKGNVEFKNEEYLKAASLYTRAIKLEPENVLLYSNRCMALLKLWKIKKAMADADKVISMRPEWQKGYYRKASVFEAQEQYEDALEWFNRAASCNTEDKRDIDLKIRNLSRVVKESKIKKRRESREQ